MSQASRLERDGPPDGPPSSSADLGGPVRTVATAFGVGVLGFVVGIVLTVVLVNVVALAGVDPMSLSGPALLLLLVVPLQGVGFPLVVFGYLRWRHLPASYLRAGLPSLRDVAIVFGGLVAVFLLVNVSSTVLMELGLTPAERSDADLLTQPEVALAAIPVMILIVGPAEELLFRGVIQTTLTEEFSTPVAILLASAAFAPAHIVAYLGSGASAVAIAVSISVLFVPSLVFGAVYEYTDNLVVPALTHGLYNATLFAVQYLDTTGTL